MSRLLLLEKQLQTYTQLGFISLEEARRRSQADNQDRDDQRKKPYLNACLVKYPFLYRLLSVNAVVGA